MGSLKVKVLREVGCDVGFPELCVRLRGCEEDVGGDEVALCDTTLQCGSEVDVVSVGPNLHPRSYAACPNAPCLAVSPSSLLLTIAGRRLPDRHEPSTFTTYDTETALCLWTTQHPARPSDLRYSPCSTLLIACLETGQIIVYTTSGSASHTLFDSSAMYVCFTLCGFGVSLGLENIVRVWDLKNDNKTPRELWGNDCYLRALFGAVDGSIACGADEDIVLMDIVSGKQAALKGHTSVVQRFSVTEDGRTAVSACLNGPIKVWNVPLRAEVHSFDLDAAPLISPRGDYILARTPEELQFYSTTGERMGSMPINERATNFFLTKCGRWMFYSDADDVAVMRVEM